MDKANTFVLQLQEGFAEVTTLIKEDKLDITQYNCMVLMMGRADLWEDDKTFKTGVKLCLAEIRKVKADMLVVLTATLPSPGDPVRIIRTAKFRNQFLSRMAADDNLLEFSRPGKHLLQMGGPDAKLFDEFNNLNKDGLDLVRRALEAKFVCAKLEVKFRQSCRRDS